MSESEAPVAVDRGSDGDEECPICLEPLPPFWDLGRRTTLTCCGGFICWGCMDKRSEVLERAVAEGAFGKEELQLATSCPLCRTRTTTGDNLGRVMATKFENGQLRLNLYSNLGGKFVDGRGGVERNVERGVQVLVLGAEKGDPNCQYLIGVKYNEGTSGLPKASAEAKRWLLAATEQGHAKAEFRLAWIFADEGNDVEFLRCLRSSAAKGFDQACYNLGVVHYNGEYGVRRSLEEATRAVTPAVERGDVDSMGLLGRILCLPDPDLPPPLHRENSSFTRGVHWIRRAAEMGDENSISLLEIVQREASSACFRCNKEAPPEKAHLRCTRCRAAWYCSKECQVQHWKAEEGGHKQFCIKWCPQK